MNDRNRRRLATVIAAPAAALIAWACLRLAGVQLVVTVGNGKVGPAEVVSAALVGALGAWVVVSFLERRASRPGLWWPMIGSTALAVSTIGPSYLSDGTSAVALIGLHFVTGIVVIYGLSATLAGRCDSAMFHRRGPVVRSDPAP